MTPQHVTTLRCSLGKRLRLARLAAGLRQADLAERTGYSRTSIAHLEAGRQGAPGAFWDKADQLLSAGGVLVAGFHTLELADAELERIKASERRKTAREQLALLHSSGLGDHQRGNALDGATADEPGLSEVIDTPTAAATLRWLIRSSGTDLTRSAGWRCVGGADIERLRRARSQHKSVDNALGGGAAYPGANTYLQREVLPLLDGQYNDATGRQLNGVASELTLDLGWMAYDAGQHVLARRHMLDALRLAEAGGHRLFGGRVLSALSHQALHLGNVREAVDLVNAAIAGTEKLAPPTAVAMFAAMKACALAVWGDRAGCEAAILAAERALERAAADDDRPDWLDFDAGGLSGHAARAYRDLAQPKAAMTYAEAALEHCNATHSRTHAQRPAILATSLVQAREIEQAAHIGRQLVTSAWQLHSALVLGDVANLVDVIDPSRSSATFAFVREARSLLAARRAVAPLHE